MFNQSHPYKHFFEGVLLGGGMGAVIALMFTKKGQKIQKNLVDKYHDFEKGIQHLVNTPEAKALKRKVKAKTLKKLATNLNPRAVKRKLKAKVLKKIASKKTHSRKRSK